ncbi:MAG: 4-alpha-glucanotransferase [Sarcina sp.]
MIKGNVSIKENELLTKEYAIVDFGEEAYKVADAIKELGSFYCEINVFTESMDKSLLHNDIVESVGNPCFINLKLLEDDNLLIESDYKDIEVGNNEEREKVLMLAYQRAKAILKLKLHEFMLEHIEWLDDYSLYMAVKEFAGISSFDEWKAYRRDYANNLERVRRDFEEDINYHIFVQYEFHKQWRNLKNYFGGLGIKGKRVLKEI